MNDVNQPFVKLGTVVLGILMIIVVLFLLSAREQVNYLVPITWGIVVFGSVLAFFQYKAARK